MRVCACSRSCKIQKPRKCILKVFLSIIRKFAPVSKSMWTKSQHRDSYIPVCIKGCTKLGILLLHFQPQNRQFKSHFVVLNHTMICDGTMIGFRKNFLSQFTQPTAQSHPIITGRKHIEWILVSSAKSRSLLLTYSVVTVENVLWIQNSYQQQSSANSVGLQGETFLA